MSKSESLSHKIIAIVVGGSILAILGYIGRAWWPIIWTTFANFIVSIWMWLSSSHSIPGWLLILFIAISLLFILVSVLWIALKFESQLSPDWRDFTQANISEILWRWRFDYAERIINLHSFCPVSSCDMQIYSKLGSYYDAGRQSTIYECDRCGYSHHINRSSHEIEDTVKREIQRLLRTGEWRNAA